MKTMLIAAVLAGTALTGAAAYAQDQTPPPPAAADAPPRQMDRGPITRADFIARADHRFDRMDANHDGVVTPDELSMMGPRRMAPPPAADAPPPPQGDDAAPAPDSPMARFAQHMFDRLDTNHDGKLTRDEVDADAAARFDAADTNHDGTLDASEQAGMRGRMYGMRHHDHRGRAGAGTDNAPPPPGDDDSNPGQ